MLGNAQHFADTWKQSGIEKRGQVARHTHIWVGRSVNLTRFNKLGQPLVELVHDKAVESNRMVDQPMESINRQACHHTGSQCRDVVAVGLTFEYRAFAKPSAWWHAGISDGATTRTVRTHFEQTFNHAKPKSDSASHTAHIVAGHGNAYYQLRFNAVAL